MLRIDGFRVVTIPAGNIDVIIYDGSGVAILLDGFEVVS